LTEAFAINTVGRVGASDYAKTCGTVLVFLGVLPQFLCAADEKEARVTEVVRTVHLLESQAAPRPATVNSTVREGSAVRTGNESRAELTFSDLSITRLGADTVFSFNPATRSYDLGSGAVLISAPKGAGTVRINTAIATCAVSGFTAIVERRANAHNKFILLNGDGVFTLKKFPHDPCRLHFGQAVISPPDPTRPPHVCGVNLSKVLHGGLVNGFKHKLPESGQIAANIEKQKQASEEQKE
jgi:hypothetical protein